MTNDLVFPPRRVVLMLLLVYVIIGAVASYAAVEAAVDGEPAVGVAAAVVALAAFAAFGGSAVAVRVALARMVLTGSAVVAPRILGRRVIPLAEIAGVGLHYASAGQASGLALLRLAGTRPAGRPQRPAAVAHRPEGHAQPLAYPARGGAAARLGSCRPEPGRPGRPHRRRAGRSRPGPTRSVRDDAPRDRQHRPGD